MKKSILIATAALLVSVSLMAQNNRGQGFQRPDEATMIKMRTERIAKEIGLDENQTAKLLELNQKYPNASRGAGMGRPGGPGMGRPGNEGQRPAENVAENNGSDNNKAADKKAKKSKKSKAAEAEQTVTTQPERPQRGGRPQLTEEQIKEMQAEREAYENELKSILTEDQLKAYQEHMNRRPQGRGPGGPGRGRGGQGFGGFEE